MGKRAVLSKNDLPRDSAILVKHDIAPYIDYPFHYHPDYELVLIEKGSGKRIIGDHIDRFRDGDLVFLSPNLPHIWKCDEKYYSEDSDLQTSCFVLHFTEDSIGGFITGIPDFSNIRQLFKDGENGIVLKNNLKKEISRKLKELYYCSGTSRIILYLEMLNSIANSDEKELLSGILYMHPIKDIDSDRFAHIYDYLLENFQNKIFLKDIAEKLSLTPSSLCRYFKSKCGKTIMEFTNEIRIKYACKLLAESRRTVLSICYESGYNNLSNFNRQFRKVMACSPKEFRAKP